jgi:DMSO reductase family type II enzyme chaperone
MTNKVSTQAILEESSTWGFFHNLFRYPTEAQYEWLNSEQVEKAINILSTNLDGFELSQLPSTFDEYHQQFLSFFEVGVPAPPYPLIESHWNKRDPVPRVIHENILFYKKFGLEIKATAQETADHLLYQLEFLSYLCKLEAEYLEADSESEATQQARIGRYEYIDRHLKSWLPKAVEKMTNEDGTWQCTWIRILNEYLSTKYS